MLTDQIVDNNVISILPQRLLSSTANSGLFLLEARNDAGFVPGGLCLVLKIFVSEPR